MSINDKGNDLSDQPLIETATVRVTDPVSGAKRRRTRGPGVPVPKVTTVTVDPQVWAAAMQIAGGNTARLEVRSATNVVVHNQPWRKR